MEEETQDKVPQRKKQTFAECGRQTAARCAAPPSTLKLTVDTEQQDKWVIKWVDKKAEIKAVVQIVNFH